MYLYTVQYSTCMLNRALLLLHECMQFMVSFRNLLRGQLVRNETFGGCENCTIHVHTCLRIVNLQGGAFTLEWGKRPHAPPK